ncbi:hypothetical protein [Azorhizobium caulinodans]|uniref:hypothetical protein n=1 Tax=Azorhizobium caulinodans TaxID=7 RepID=UPI001564A752|nr:hypothetical protein [Azorhizobium caulinodans]
MAVGEGAVVLRLDSEQAAWNALNALLDKTIDAKNVILDLDDMSWAGLRLIYKGNSFDGTIPTSVMKSLVEFQNDFYRTAALILKDDDRVTRLTDQEKEDLELIFTLKKGSSDFWAFAEKQIKGIGEKAIDKMTGRQILIGFIVAILVYFTQAGVTAYINSQLEMKKIELQEKQIESNGKEKKDLYEFLEKVINDRRTESTTLKKAERKSPIAAKIYEHSNHAMSEIIKNSTSVDELNIQGAVFDSSSISILTRSTRSKSSKIVIKKQFYVRGVDTEQTSAFQVRLESVDGEDRFTAILEDPLVGAKYQKAIERAEWSQKPVVVHVNARRVGEEIRDAKIVRAHTPRSRTA